MVKRVEILSSGWLLIEGLEVFDIVPARILQSNSDRWREGQVVVWKDRPVSVCLPGDLPNLYFIHESQVVAELDPAMLKPAVSDA